MRDGATTTLSGVVVKDPRTVEFTLTTAVPYLPSLAGHLTVCILKAIFLAPFRGTSIWFFKPQVRGMKVTFGRIWHSTHKMYIAAE